MAKSAAFAEQKKGKSVQSTVQMISSVQGSHSPKEEQQLNVWIGKDLMKRLKVKSAETGKSLKEMVILALEQSL